MMLSSSRRFIRLFPVRSFARGALVRRRYLSTGGADVERRILDMRREVERFRHAYYVDGISLVKDDQFDALFHELERLEGEHPEVADSSSPIHQVGPTPTRGGHAHRSPMLSLKNANSEDDVMARIQHAVHAVQRVRVSAGIMEM
eukprot:TRINITY_DN875_c0_g1_i2.p1 TRINITY_DN875_c0_g1~~TRINITY_DN875_c0_g1_i2.p1  ORF type:complete len:145 (+),score=21.09 TRINITY_DN875_c0_g1_i2:159-593(+)